jgi:hypothetical protein
VSLISPRQAGRWDPARWTTPRNNQSQLEPACAGSALRGMPFTQGITSLGPSLERHA